MKNSWYFLIILFLFFACAENNPEDCPEGIICTENFVVLALDLRENGEAVILTEYEVLNLTNDNRYSFEEYQVEEWPGYYPVISDAQFDEINKEGTTLRLLGTTDQGEPYEIDFEVAHDCCHVIPLSGPFKDTE